MVTTLFVFSACGTKNVEVSASSTASVSSTSASSETTTTTASTQEDSKASSEASTASASKDDQEKGTSEATKTDSTNGGKSINFEVIDYTVNSVEKVKTDGYFAKSGSVFYVMNITAKNATDTEQSLTHNYKLTDSEGNQYLTAIDGSKVLEDNKISELDGNIPTSGELKGGLVFEIPENAKGLKFVISDFLGSNNVTLDLE